MKLSRLVEICDILNRYYPESDTAAEHDILYLGGDPKLVSADDAAKLEKLGAVPCPEFNCWSMFV